MSTAKKLKKKNDSTKGDKFADFMCFNKSHMNG